MKYRADTNSVGAAAGCDLLIFHGRKKNNPEPFLKNPAIPPATSLCSVYSLEIAA
jgi:hypothetical protein